MTLTDFLEARLDEAAAGAWAVHDVSKCDALLYEQDMAEAAMRDPDCDCGHPARVLREVEAKRAILQRYIRFRDRKNGTGSLLDRVTAPPIAAAMKPALWDLATVDRDHPDFRPEWEREWG